MGDPRYDEYVEYYQARAQRRTASPLYPHSAAAEVAMLTAIEQAGSIEAFQASIGDLPLRSATALARDQAEARAQLFAETAESARAQEPAEVLAGLDGVADVAALTALMNAAAQRANTAVTADSFYSHFALSLPILENIETWMSAQVPERWRPELDGWAGEAAQDAQAVWRDVEAEARQWDPEWRFDDDVLREARHRRLLPMPQSVLDRRLAQHRVWVRGES